MSYNSSVDLNIKDFIQKELNDVCGKIDVDPRILLPKRSEKFVQKVLKDKKGDLVTNEAVHNIMHRFRRKAHKKGFRRILILGAFGLGKSFLKGNQVLTATYSPLLVENVKVGDLLLGPDGNPRKVLFLGNGVEPAYKITLSNKDFFTCNESHILSLIFRRDGMGYIKGDILDIQLKDYLKLPEWVKKQCLRMYKVPIEMELKSTPIDPYTYGQTIGGFRNKHGFRKTQFYRIWCHMKERCDNKNVKFYNHYGGRGIVYDSKWNEFINFKKDMYLKYILAKREYRTTKFLSIERKDVNGNYCFENCIFIPRSKQGKNTRKQKWFKAISPEGLIYISNSQTNFAKQHGLQQTSIGQYLNKGIKNKDGWRFKKLKNKVSLKRKSFEDRQEIIEKDYKIDKLYLHNSREVRLKVLAGYLDLHGSISGGESYRTITKSIVFRDELLFLCRSLGFSVSHAEETYNKTTFYRIVISGDVNLIPCRERKIKLRYGRGREKRTSLEYSFNIESIGEQEYFGFGLDEDHKFLLNDFTVAHNTEQMCVGFSLYLLAKNPESLIKIVHVSEEEAINRVRAIRDYISRDKDFKEMCPHISPTIIWGSKKLIITRKGFSKDPSIQAFSILSGALGGRATCIIFDDPQDLKTAVLEPTTRETIETTFKNVWLSRMVTDDDAEVIVMMNKWHESLAKSSELLGKTGLKKISKFKIGDEVLTSNGIYEKVLKTHRGLYKGSLYKIIPYYFSIFDFECTHDHEVFTREGYKYTNKLTLDDYLVIPIPKFANSWKESCLYYFKEERKHKSKKPKSVLNFISKDDLKNLIEKGTNYKEISKMYDVSVGTVYNLVHFYKIQTTKFNNISNSIFEDLTFWRIVGYWVAEGSITYGTIKENRDVIRFSFGSKESKYIKEVKEFFENYGIYVGEDYTNRGSCNLKISCKQLSHWLVKNFGEYSHKKRLPDWFFGLPEDFFFEFLIGYSNGDGWDNGENINICSVSKTLLFQIQLNLLRFGLISSLNNSSKGKIKTVDFGWGKTEINCRNSYNLRINEIDKKQAYIDGDNLFVKIRKIEKRNYYGYVYDITTPSHDFISPFVVHNSDISAYIMNNPQWAWMQIGINEDKESLFYKDSFGLERNLPLWSKFGKQEIINRHREIGDRDFNRGYRLIPYSDKDKTFPNFENCCHYGIKPKSVIADSRDWVFVGGIDFAGIKRTGTILTICGLNKNTGKKVPVEIYAFTGTSGLIEVIVETWKIYGVEVYNAENNAVQSTIIDMLTTELGEGKLQKYGIKVEGVTTGKSKADPITGLPSIQKEFENNEWMFCFERQFSIDDDKEKNLWYRLHQEFKHHPFHPTSDIVMALYFCRQAMVQFMRGSGGPNIY